MQVEEGDLAQLNCYATGVPTPQIIWRRGDVEITSRFDVRFQISQQCKFFFTQNT